MFSFLSLISVKIITDGNVLDMPVFQLRKPNPGRVQVGEALVNVMRNLGSGGRWGECHYWWTRNPLFQLLPFLIYL